MPFPTRTAVASAFLIAWLAPPPAPAFELPPSFPAAKISPVKPAGASYRIRSPVRSDGLLRVYVVDTPYGEFTAQGDQMLRLRLNELVAVTQLEKASGTEAFAKAFREAGVSPIRYTGRFFADPGKTVGDTLNGVGAVFERVASGVANAGMTPGNPVAALLGVSDQKRKFAAALGVDPYTDYAPLDDRLSRLSEAAAAGGLTVSGALMAIPGAAGIVVSNLSTANTLQGIALENLARDYTAAQIVDLNRARLSNMGVERNLAEMLLANRHYTPIEAAALVAALDRMEGVEDRALFVGRAAEIDNRAIAIFMRRHAELLAARQARTRGIARFVLLAGYPFVLTRGGRVVGVMPIDALAWTPSTAAALGESANDARRMGRGGVELRITGMATALAKRQLAARGWRVVEHARH
jgi:hypothetical protein